MTVYVAECHIDGEAGPKIQCTAEGVSLIDPDAWAIWLDDHGTHVMELWKEQVPARLAVLTSGWCMEDAHGFCHPTREPCGCKCHSEEKV